MNPPKVARKWRKIGSLVLASEMLVPISRSRTVVQTRVRGILQIGPSPCLPAPWACTGPLSPSDVTGFGTLRSQLQKLPHWDQISHIPLVVLVKKLHLGSRGSVGRVTCHSNLASSLSPYTSSRLSGLTRPGATQTLQRSKVHAHQEGQRRRRSLFVFMDAVEGPRAPAGKLTAHHSSLESEGCFPVSRQTPTSVQENVLTLHGTSPDTRSLW